MTHFDTSTFNTLYCSFMRSQLECTSVVWSFLILHNWQWKTIVLPALHVHFLFLDILQTFSFFREGEMTCFAVVWTMWAYDGKCSILSHLWSAGFNLILRIVRIYFTSVMALNSWETIACRLRSERKRCTLRCLFWKIACNRNSNNCFFSKEPKHYVLTRQNANCRKVIFQPLS